jgi:hypothetical protein
MTEVKFSTGQFNCNLCKTPYDSLDCNMFFRCCSYVFEFLARVTICPQKLSEIAMKYGVVVSNLFESIICHGTCMLYIVRELHELAKTEL